MRPVVYTLLGPTGAGKTALLETLADLAPGRYEIISCDSRQIYRGLEIGSAAPVAELCARLPHHVVGHVSPAESYSAARFREEALAAIAETLARGRIPFLVGGSGFYFRALSTQLFESPGDEHSQAEIRARVSALSPAGRLARLRELDSDALAAPGEQPSAGRVHVNDDYRIGRALEICLSGGPLYSERWRASLARLQNATDSDSGGEGDYRFALIASTLLPEERSGQSGVWKKYQIASLFYLTMGDAESAPEVTTATVTKSADGETAVVFDLENSGNAHARLRGDIEITGDSGETISEAISNLVVLHDGTRKYKLPIAGALPENPQVKVTLENIFAPQASGGAVMLEPFTYDLSYEETALTAGAGNDAETALE